MAATMIVNGRTVVHKGSEGAACAIPDVCFTPPAHVPIPYVNFAFSSDASDTAATVFCDGEPIMIRSSSFGKSVGDQPGTEGGVMSGVVGSKAQFTNYSYDVKVEGEEVPRLLDPMVHNVGIFMNAASPAEAQPNAVADAARDVICKAVCFCWETVQTAACVTAQLASVDQGPDGRFYNPFNPTIFPEYTVPTPAPGGNVDRFGRPAAPAGNFPLGSRRPDAVVTTDGQVPRLGPDSNIAAVYDVKFPGDRWRAGQFQAYRDIFGMAPIELNPKNCGCSKDERQKELARLAVLALLAIAAALGKTFSDTGKGLLQSEPAGFPFIWWRPFPEDMN